MPSDTAHDLVLNEREGQLGRIRLNRPKALNSLSLAMIREISAALDRFEADPGVAAVLLTGEGERGLCAGGDIKAAYEHRGDAEFLETYFREEYRLNYRIARFPKPYVAVMDGITMGGGVGVSAHGSHRIVTERTRLAMPETGIGFFPDIGATWLLARAPGETGTYLGLTGIAIGAADSIEAGLADAFVPSDRLSTLIASLAASTDAGDVTRRIATRAEPPGPAALADRAGIDAAFAHDSVAAILAALERQDSDFARETHRILLSRSPTSLKLTLRLLREARKSAGLAACLQREFTACLHAMKGREFYEGVRAAVIDKDRTPRWSPATLDEVSESDIDAYFAEGGPQLGL